MLKLFKTIYNKLFYYIKMFVWPFRTFVDSRGIPFMIRIRMIFKGFRPVCYYLYEFNKYDIKLYANDFKKETRPSLIKENSLYETNKILFQQLIHNKVPTPELFATIFKGDLISLNKKKMLDIQDVFDFALKHGGAIIKPISSNNGVGVHLLQHRNGVWQLNNDKTDEHLLSENIRKLNGYFISSFIHQAKYSSDMYPGSANTIRIVTFINPDDNKAFIHRAVHRVGTSRSFPVDNFSHGALVVDIDLKTGVMGKGIALEKNTYKRTEHTHHPETGATIEGVTIPHWKMISEAILYLSQELRFFYRLGWDIIVTENDFCVLEGNADPGLRIQLAGPFLKDERVRRFYKHHGLIN